MVLEEASKLELQNFSLLLQLFRDWQITEHSGLSKNQDFVDPR